ncbi:Flagellum site-determining protein YlxH [Zhongshania aliphaticivorans]|uniref:Flagellum site-determining protein YlxH n=2 Tax=Zhongshania aliphaticivorans TaxID=1470434 RepID=A0A5S9P4I8_9GAMM|nr:Flagellum site-determining protein YlxH [Zhongshania aliphaticivorans]CAA0098143.1 Flagellum site-determining protein YlxH [Zhongshania aliphaticivorans]
MSAVKVIAVSSGKGGVGKTNVSVNLACQLARRGNRVLLMDADLGLANVDIMLGLKPKWNLSHVLDGKCSIEDVLIPGPDGITIIPAASGIKKMAELASEQHAAIVRSLSALSGDYDVMIVDTAAGISDSVITFSRASQYVLVVVTDELTSMADAYALIKVMNRDAGIKRFKVLRNMVNSHDQARDGFERLNEVAQRFLDVTLEYAGFIPRDPYLIKADTRQKAVSDLYPGAESSMAFRRLAETVDKWDMPSGPNGGIEFFVDRMFAKDAVAGAAM